MTAPPETKVAAGGAAGLTVTAVLQALTTWWHGFVPPPASLTALLVTIVSLVAAWAAPHTPRPGTVPAPLTTFFGQPLTFAEQGAIAQLLQVMRGQKVTTGTTQVPPSPVSQPVPPEGGQAS